MIVIKKLIVPEEYISELKIAMNLAIFYHEPGQHSIAMNLASIKLKIIYFFNL